MTLVLRAPAGDRRLTGTVLAFGLLFRLAVLPTPVMLSSDVYRYLWDGRVQWAGVNPYRYPPAADTLAPLRDPDVFPRVNRPAEPTVYPPGAELVFALAAALAPGSLLGWRLLVCVAEVATGVLLLGLLRRMDLPRSRVIVYAWAPLAVFEGAQAGHVDFVMLPLLLLALRWRQTGRLARAGAALGLAVLVKLYPAVLLLAWRRRGERRLAAAFAGVVALGYLAYVGGAGSRVTGFLPRYFGSAEDFNIGLRVLVEAALAPLVPGAEARRAVAMAGLFAALAVVLVRIGRRGGEDAVAVVRAGMAAVAAYLILVPTAMHAWYAVWIVPFLAIRPSPAWLYFTGAVSLSYLKYAWEPEGLPAWVGVVEFVPFYALLLREWRAARAAAAAIGRA